MEMRALSLLCRDVFVSRMSDLHDADSARASRLDYLFIHVS